VFFFIASTDLCFFYFFVFGAGVIGRVIEGNR
jgi:hypothetical protein